LLTEYQQVNGWWIPARQHATSWRTLAGGHLLRSTRVSSDPANQIGYLYKRMSWRFALPRFPFEALTWSGVCGSWGYDPPGALPTADVQVNARWTDALSAHTLHTFTYA